MKKFVFVLTMFLLSTGCPVVTPFGQDAGANDAGAVGAEGEGEVIDAGDQIEDAGEEDAGIIVEVDAGVVIEVDAGILVDSGIIVEVDAGIILDAGIFDTTEDAGTACVGGPRFDPAGVPHVGNGLGQQFIGGQCFNAADCASGCCAGPCGICSGVGAQFQAGKTGCGFSCH